MSGVNGVTPVRVVVPVDSGEDFLGALTPISQVAPAVRVATSSGLQV